ncbi:Hypothetical protein CAP_4255 [Chondromyces apiculatus DSM 436]|uniref:Uncharacterized protein n=2 Tax=Chondromyces apiculatus TaxID=51 RepID=A0A017T6B9_9BACT|nr:Hypothetical protein CAP_4255 [Chondromyces apiculatus DSM 436]
MLTWVGAAMLLAGCMAAPEDEPFDEGSDDEEATAEAVSAARPEGPLGVNGMNPVDFWKPENQQALRTLGQSALVGADGALVPSRLRGTDGGRSVLGYALKCALDAGDGVEDESGTLFPGRMGLAAAWKTRGLDAGEQRWVTACLLQHLNGVGAHVPILLLGNHPALDRGDGLSTQSFGVPDATAFGNLFTSNGKAYVCANVGLQLACGVGLSLSSLQRLCGLSPTCGINVLGLCALSCAYDAEGDPSCGLLLGPSYPEAIATRLETSTFVSLYPLCSAP